MAEDHIDTHIICNIEEPQQKYLKSCIMLVSIAKAKTNLHFCPDCSELLPITFNMTWMGHTECSIALSQSFSEWFETKLLAVI